MIALGMRGGRDESDGYCVCIGLALARDGGLGIIQGCMGFQDGMGISGCKACWLGGRLPGHACHLPQAIVEHVHAPYIVWLVTCDCAYMHIG